MEPFCILIWVMVTRIDICDKNFLELYITSEKVYANLVKSE